MEGKQLTTFVVTLVCIIVSTITVSLRSIVRVSINGFGVDDGLMVVGQLLYFGACVAVLFGCKYGFGVRDIYLTPEDMINARHSFVAFQCTYLTSLIFVKGSICFALLRITTTRWIKYYLYFIIFLSFCGGFITTTAVLALCKPVSASWTGVGKCASAEVLVGVAYFVTVTSIITDFSCSILPFLILYKLQMKKSLKYTLAAILAVGFIASAATVVRAFYFDRFTKTVDYLWGASDLALWSIIEDGVATTLGSLPGLKPLLRNVKFFSMSSNRTSKKTSQNNGSRFQMDTYKSSNGKGGNVTTTITNRDQDSESVRNILEEEGIMISSELNVKEEYLFK